MGVMKLLCDRSRRLYESLTDQSMLSLPARIVRMLLTLSTVFGVADCDEAGVTYLHLSQGNLSDMIGVTRQSLSAELKMLERLGLLNMSYTRIELN